MLEASNLTVSYADSISALRGVDITLPEGGFVAVLGSNGAGKTSLLRAASGTLRWQRGKVVGGTLTHHGLNLLDRDPAAIVRLGLAHIPEGRRIFTRLTVADNLRIGASTVRSRTSRAAALERSLKFFPELTAFLEKRAGLLSGGQQQMLAIARALMSQPRTLLLDEPSLGLAPQMIQRVGAALQAIHQEGTSVLLVEQNAALALKLATTAYVLTLGSVSLVGPADKLATSGDVAGLYLADTAPIGDRVAAVPPARAGE